MKNIKLAACSLICVVVVGFAYTKVSDHMLVKSVKQGDKILTCHIGSEDKQIEPEKVTGFIEGVWLFSNGSASQCKITDAL